MTTNTPTSVGLGGDGDEIEAIDDVERAFGIKLDYSEAPQWLTAGDVFDSLRKALPDDERDKTDLWERFAVALCSVTGVNPKTIERGSPLLSDSRIWARMADASAVIWIAIILAFTVVIVTAALTSR